MITYNRIDFTQKALGSIINRTKYPCRLIVVDNNSTDGTKEYLRGLKNAGLIDILVDNVENVGLERALNVGLTYVESDYFVTTDNDCIAPDLSPCWLEQLKSLMDKNEDYAAIALRPQILVGVGAIFKTDKEIAENNVVGGSYRMFRKSAVKEVGSWSDRFLNDGRGQEEFDICTRLREKGYKVGYTKDLWTYHLFGEDGTWGYSKDSNYKMGRSLDRSPMDVSYDKKTCEPQIKANQ